MSARPASLLFSTPITLPMSLIEAAPVLVMAALILWMGIGSPFFTRRTEAYTQNVLQLMQRPQAYNASAPNLDNVNHSAMPATGADSAPSGSGVNLVNPK